MLRHSEIPYWVAKRLMLHNNNISHQSSPHGLSYVIEFPCDMTRDSLVKELVAE